MGIFGKLVGHYQRNTNTEAYWKKRGVQMGKGCKIYPTADFGSEPYLITLGDNVRVTGRVQFIPHDGGVWVLRNLYTEHKDIDLFGKIVIGNNVHVGMNAIIMPGVTIGSNCIIGCGAVVTKDIPDNSVAVGVPARVIKTIDEYEQKNRPRFKNTKGMDDNEKQVYLQNQEL